MMKRGMELRLFRRGKKVTAGDKAAVGSDNDYGEEEGQKKQWMLQCWSSL